ncbi:flagellar protein FlaG [Anaerosalibacter massiliensis]|uniref:Flagellar protein FlaG n=1 Tax=Anaerosalibacter massiliensis TaxID=1347392 RepID=A0A9X2MKL3_9FIRM|nr:flagellar protein FlaG [Anaerosalibacter massiliensis]MCR2044770.1 flagellar protein FlaG [Anaerosalibacter massiliensis]
MKVGESLSTNVNNYGIRGGERSSQNTNLNINKGQTLLPDEKKYTQEEIIDAIESANEKFIIYDRRFEFSIHDQTKQIMVKVIDVNTNEIIREIPPEKILDLVAAIWEITGIVVDEKI